MNVVCGVLKLYFRELPEPLVPTELFHRLAQMLGKITQQPPPPRETCSFMFRKCTLSTHRNFRVRLLLLSFMGSS